MKKILLLFLMLCFALPSLAEEKSFNGIEIRDAYFSNKTSIYSNYGNLEYYGHFLIKGIWADKTKQNKDVMFEEILCKNSDDSCISSFSIVSFLGYPLIKSLYHDSYLNNYKIIEKNKYKYKIYSSITGYTIEVDLQNKTASKYKVFENGDVNNYYFISDVTKANNYIKTLFD